MNIMWKNNFILMLIFISSAVGFKALAQSEDSLAEVLQPYVKSEDDRFLITRKEIAFAEKILTCERDGHLMATIKQKLPEGSILKFLPEHRQAFKRTFARQNLPPTGFNEIALWVENAKMFRTIDGKINTYLPATYISPENGILGDIWIDLDFIKNHYGRDTITNETSDIGPFRPWWATVFDYYDVQTNATTTDWEHPPLPVSRPKNRITHKKKNNESPPLPPLPVSRPDDYIDRIVTAGMDHLGIYEHNPEMVSDPYFRKNVVVPLTRIAHEYKTRKHAYSCERELNMFGYINGKTFLRVDEYFQRTCGRDLKSFLTKGKRLLEEKINKYNAKLNDADKSAFAIDLDVISLDELLYVLAAIMVKESKGECNLVNSSTNEMATGLFQVTPRTAEPKIGALERQGKTAEARVLFRKTLQELQNPERNMREAIDALLIKRNWILQQLNGTLAANIDTIHIAYLEQLEGYFSSFFKNLIGQADLRSKREIEWDLWRLTLSGYNGGEGWVQIAADGLAYYQKYHTPETYTANPFSWEHLRIALFNGFLPPSTRKELYGNRKARSDRNIEQNMYYVEVILGRGDPFKPLDGYSMVERLRTGKESGLIDYIP